MLFAIYKYVYVYVSVFVTGSAGRFITVLAATCYVCSGARSAAACFLMNGCSITYVCMYMHMKDIDPHLCGKHSNAMRLIIPGRKIIILDYSTGSPQHKYYPLHILSLSLSLSPRRTSGFPRIHVRTARTMSICYQKMRWG
mmetsp:Transcript_13211/g.22112  ORF Transcript_13211/g.22112 Transcript_13211/m.22112 type:complete len:141 (+) Transcript_13211:127-549(+)